MRIEKCCGAQQKQEARSETLTPKSRVRVIIASINIVRLELTVCSKTQICDVHYFIRQVPDHLQGKSPRA